MNRLMMKLMGHVLMNEAPADGAPSGGSTATTTDAAPAASTTENTVLTPQAAPAATDPKPEGDQAKPEDPAKPDDGKTKDGKKDEPQGAPEAYEFKLPDGMEIDAEVLGEFTAFAKELNLPQDKAQKIVDFQAKLASKQADEYQAAVEKQKEQWMAAVKNDPDLGGENYEKSVASAVKVVQAFGSPELREVLSATGLGNNPELFKFVHRISQAISEDKFVMPGSQTAAPKEMSIVDAFK